MGVSISATVMKKIESMIQGTFHGSVTLIIQDSRLIQLERIEKVRVVELEEERKAASQPGEGLQPRIAASLRGLKFGHITIIIKGGAVVQIERTEKRRFTEWEGLDGDGI